MYSVYIMFGRTGDAVALWATSARYIICLFDTVEGIRTWIVGTVDGAGWKVGCEKDGTVHGHREFAMVGIAYVLFAGWIHAEGLTSSIISQRFPTGYSSPLSAQNRLQVFFRSKNLYAFES